MAGSRDAMLAVARRNIGVVERPRGSNRNPFSALLKRPAEPWCADFLVACALRVGVKLPAGAESAYTPAMADGFRKAGRFGKRAAVGAFVFYRWPGLGRIGHAGIVEAVNRDGSIIAIEGNTDAAGGRTGGRVMRQRRRAFIVGYGYPVYATSSTRPLLRRGSKGAGVVEWQRKIGVVPPDGDFGPATEAATKAWQRRHKLTADGEVGPDSYRAAGLK